MGRNRPLSGARTRKGFRLDIQGVRGFALVLVLACHAEVPGFAGGFVGLDVFYVLSGFLITGLILTELDRRGDVSISRFYARRAKRLLPLAVTVLAFVVVGSALLYSPLQNQKVSGDVLSAALYVVNWHFIAESVDYFAFHNQLISPVQHYWSLSVEEQFYLLWPLTLGVGAGLARWRGWSMRRTIALLVVPLGVASLIYSVGFTPEHTRAAYFSTLTRMWELAMGGVLALALPAGLNLPRRVSALLAGAGLATLLATALIFTGDTPYPGWRALLPTLATVAIIVAGTAVAVSGPISLLSRAPMQYLGKISYAWYLWHWPILVFAGVLWNLSRLDLVLVTLASWGPAALTHYTIEERFATRAALGGGRSGRSPWARPARSPPSSSRSACRSRTRRCRPPRRNWRAGRWRSGRATRTCSGSTPCGRIPPAPRPTRAPSGTTAASCCTTKPNRRPASTAPRTRRRPSSPSATRTPSSGSRR